jgi:hypothetical protein
MGTQLPVVARPLIEAQLKKAKEQLNPKGEGMEGEWTVCLLLLVTDRLLGVVHELNHVQSKLPPQKRYIQSATTKWVKNSDGKEHPFQAAVTMLPSRADLAHRSTYFTADTTYKTTKSDTKQFRICTVDPELGERTWFMVITLS